MRWAKIGQNRIGYNGHGRENMERNETRSCGMDGVRTVLNVTGKDGMGQAKRSGGLGR